MSPPSPPASTTPVYGPPAGVNAKAIVALPLAVAFSLLGVVLGHVARAEIRRTGERGEGIARTALIIGYAVTGLWVLFWLTLIGAVLFTT